MTRYMTVGSRIADAVSMKSVAICFVVVVALLSVWQGLVEASQREKLEARAVGLCFKTGIGAIGMAYGTSGPTTLRLMFSSGLKEAYALSSLQPAACPDVP